MEVKCPNCGKDIHIIGAKELKDEYGLGANAVAHARERGKFPIPWLSFGNRNLYVRAEVDGYVEERSRGRVEATITELLNSIDRLPEDEQAAARHELEERLLGRQDGASGAKRSRAKR